MYAVNLSLFGLDTSCIFSAHLPNGIGSSLSSVMPWVFPTTVLPIPRMMLFVADTMVVLNVCLFFLPEYVSFRLSLSPERRTGMWVPSTSSVPAPLPGMNSFRLLCGLAFRYSL